VATSSPTVLRAGTSDQSKDLCRLKPQQELLVISDQDFKPVAAGLRSGTQAPGVCRLATHCRHRRSAHAESDPTVRRLSGWPPDWPTVVIANRWIRLATWGLLAAFGLLAAWKTTDFDSFLVWGTAFFLAAQLLVFTKIWPGTRFGRWRSERSNPGIRRARLASFYRPE